MDLKKTVKQTTKSGQIIPEVRYHPSIQASPNRTLISQTHKAKARTTAVQKKQADSTDRRTRPHNPVQRPGPAQRPGPVQRPDAVQRPGPARRPGPVQRPDAAQRPGPPGDGDPPEPKLVPPGVQVPLVRSVVDQVEVLTRGQRTNPKWFAWRRNRITASVAHRIAHSRFANGMSQTPPASYLAAITGSGPTVQTRAMSWGVRMEAEAVRRYQELKTAALGRPVSVQDCGLFIDAQRPWLAASPDGIVTDGRSGERLLCLEVKCPYKHRHRRVEDACRDDPAFCLQIQDWDQDRDQDQDQDPDGRASAEPPAYRLKTSHSYFTQIQVQLAVTGLRQADLVVFTLKETAVVPVTFDPELWEETVSRLERFYRDAVLPVTGSVATLRPEL